MAIVLACATLLAACSSGGEEDGGATVRPVSTPGVDAATATPTPLDGPSVERAADVAVGSGLGDPRDVTLPAAAGGADVAVYFEVEGAALIDVVAVLADVWLEPPGDDDQCAALAERLDATGSPAELQRLASAVPDDVLSDALANLLAAGGGVLSTCGTGVTDVGALAWEWSIVTALLADRGVAA